MISVTAALAYYRDQVECLRLVGRAARTPSFASKRFQNLTPQQVQDRLGEMRDELDRQVVLVLVASTEAAVRRDHLARVQAAATSASRIGLRRWAFRLRLPAWVWQRIGSLEERLVDLRVRYGDKLPFEALLDVWKQAGAAPNVVGEFKKLIKHRHWLAHGRYFQDKSGWAKPPDPLSAHTVIEALVFELTGLRSDFPVP